MTNDAIETAARVVDREIAQMRADREEMLRHDRPDDAAAVKRHEAMLTRLAAEIRGLDKPAAPEPLRCIRGRGYTE